MKTPPRFRKTKEELLHGKHIANSENKYRKFLASPKCTLEKEAWAKKKVAKLAEVKAEFEQSLECRRAKQELEWVEQKFPASTSFTVDELQVAHDQFESSTIRSFFNKRIAAINQRVKDVEVAAREQEQAEKAAQDELDFAGAEIARTEVLDWAYVLLVKPISVKVRLAFQDKCQSEVEKCRESLLSTSPDQMDATGARMRAIIRGYLSAFEELVQRLQVYQIDVTRPPSDDDLKKDKAILELGCAPENWNFRSTNGKVSEEQCRLVYAMKRYFSVTHQEYRLDSLATVPEPTPIPTAAPGTLTRALMMEQSQIQGADPAILREQERQARLERMRVEAPKEYAALSASALEPLNMDREVITLYAIQTATADNPSSRPEHRFPDGRIARRGKDFQWDYYGRRWVGMPDFAATWTIDATAKKHEMEEQLELEQQRISADRVSQFHEHVYADDSNSGKHKPTPTTLSALPYAYPEVQFITGDNKPPKDDPRTEFRFGSWFTPQQVEEADKASVDMFSASARYQDRRPYRMEIPTNLYQPDRDTAKPLPEPEFQTKWQRHESKIREQQPKEEE